MKKEIIIFAIIAIAIFLFLVTRGPSDPKELVKEKNITDYSNAFFYYKVIRYPTNVEIIQPQENVNLGIVTDPWNLNFGSLPGNGSYVKRYVSVTNVNEKYNRITLKSYGNISTLLNFSKNDFTINENESTAVEVTMNTKSAEIGNYSGEIDAIIKVPKYDFLSVLT